MSGRELEYVTEVDPVMARPPDADLLHHLTAAAAQPELEREAAG